MSKTKQKTYTVKELIEIFKKSPYSSGHILNFLKWLQKVAKILEREERR